jgi:hypothetical protein
MRLVQSLNISLCFLQIHFWGFELKFLFLYLAGFLPDSLSTNFCLCFRKYWSQNNQYPPWLLTPEQPMILIQIIIILIKRQTAGLLACRLTITANNAASS